MTRDELVDMITSIHDVTAVEAIKMIEETQQMLYESDPFDASDIMMDELGIEPDYIQDILYF